jgi:MYXO-CTERM domain-containing protein
MKKITFLAATLLLSSSMAFSQGAPPSGDTGEQSNAMNRQPDEVGHNWGLLGLVGLLGLAGLRHSDRKIEPRNDQRRDEDLRHVA